jgi:uncharacterized BrkB/YihY/UPF0761 family membrane protein
MASGRAIFRPMEYIFPILIALAMLATLGVLFAGVIGMARRGNAGSQAAGLKSNKLMQWRVILQAAALLLFALFMMLYRR